MDSRKWPTILAPILFSAAAITLAQLPGTVVAMPPANDPHAHHHHHHKAPEGIQRTEANYSLPGVTLVNQHKEEVYLPDLLKTDQPVLINFIFTTCTAICPTMAATFASVQNKLGDNSGKIRMISVSIDPEFDTPEALNEYAKRFRAGPQWTFLTGSLEDSVSVQKAFDADRGDKMNHAPMTLLRASSDSTWIRYEGFANADELTSQILGKL